MGGSRYGFVGVGGGGLLIGPLFGFVGLHFLLFFFFFFWLVAGFLVELEVTVMVVVVWWCCDDGCDGGSN